MIDRDGFRANVGIILSNDARQLFWAKRIGQTSWQFPQGGVRPGESLEAAMYRELYEETGLQPSHVDILAMTDDWLRYRLPERYIRHGTTPLCLGQKQKWFLLKLTANESCIDLNIGSEAIPEFDDWRWVNYWAPLKSVIDFKRNVYHQALTEMESILFERNSDDALLRG